MAKHSINHEHQMHMLQAMRTVNDLEGRTGRGEERISQKRTKAYTFFRFVENFSLAKSLRMVNEMYPHTRN